MQDQVQQNIACFAHFCILSPLAAKIRVKIELVWKEKVIKFAETTPGWCQVLQNFSTAEPGTTKHGSICQLLC